MSQIVLPDSTIIARAPGADASLMIEDIELEKSLNKAINPYNDLFRDRRPEMYQILGRTEDS